MGSHFASELGMSYSSDIVISSRLKVTEKGSLLGSCIIQEFYVLRKAQVQTLSHFYEALYYMLEKIQEVERYKTDTQKASSLGFHIKCVNKYNILDINRYAYVYICACVCMREREKRRERENRGKHLS